MQFSGYIMLLSVEKQLCNEDFFFFFLQMSTTQKDSLKIHSGRFKNTKVFKTLTQCMGDMQGIFPKPRFHMTLYIFFQTKKT